MKSKKTLAQISGITEWPTLNEFAENSLNNIKPDWEIPLWVYKSIKSHSVNIDFETINFIVIALACMQSSIILVDDILDSDPRGAHHEIGYGEAANLALALQSLAYSVVQNSESKPSKRNEIIDELNRLQLETAFGQHIDNQTIRSEKGYWYVVEHKSRPFYEATMTLGAILADVDKKTVAKFKILGSLFGEIVQLNDDIEDAFQTPANPDWERQGNNLLIIYAQTADYIDKNRFKELLPLAFLQEACLLEAKNLLITSGALSYAVYKLVEKYKQAVSLIKNLEIGNPDILNKLFIEQVEPIDTLLKDLGITNSIVTLASE